MPIVNNNKRSSNSSSSRSRSRSRSRSKNKNSVSNINSLTWIVVRGYIDDRFDNIKTFGAQVYQPYPICTASKQTGQTHKNTAIMGMAEQTIL
jgi:preprotein translocase subunit Sec63